MGDQGIFKTSTFGGFEKKGVLSYIDEMNNKAKEAQESLNQRLEEMTAARDDLGKQVSAFESKITQLEEQLKAEREKINQLTGVINNLNSEITAQKRTVLEKENEIKLQAERNRQLQFRAESLEFKSRKYDETTMKVGAILVEAKQSAERILDNARQEAQEIRESTEQSVQVISGEIDNFRGDVAKLRQSIVEAMASITAKLDSLEQAVDEIEARCTTLGQKEELGAIVQEMEVDASQTKQAEPEQGFFRPAAN